MVKPDCSSISLKSRKGIYPKLRVSVTILGGYQ